MRSMKHRRSLSQWVTVLLITLLYGCASKPYIPSKDQRLDSATYGVYQNIKLQALVNECKQYRGATQEVAYAAQESWWERNWPYVYAADQEFLAHTEQRQMDYGEEEGLLFVLKFAMESEARADEEAKKVSRARPNEKEMCERLLSQYRDGEMELRGSAKHFPVLSYLLEKYGVKEAVPYSVPTMKTSYRARAKVGKSYYKAEQIAATTWCSRVIVLNIKDLWPQELYGAYCDNGSMHLITCEWGNCTAKQK